VAASSKFRHASLQLRPRSLPEILVAASRLKVDVFAHPSLLWLIDAIVAAEYLPVAWTTVSKKRDSLDGLAGEDEGMLSTLTSTERVRYTALGEVPKFYHALLQAASEQHPMVSAVRDVERYLTAPPGK